MCVYLCIKCYENKKPNTIIYLHPDKFLCPKHGLLSAHRNVVPILNIEQVKDDKEIFSMSQNNGTGTESNDSYDPRTGMKIVELGEGHFATERTELLTKAKIEAMKTMPQKASMDRNNQGKYRYTSFNQFIEHTRSHLLEAGLVLTPSILKMERESDQNGTVWLWVAWKIEHYESGQWEQIVIPSFANNQDKGYKHLSKALSYNIKDMLRMAFMVPSGDEDDPDDDSTQEEWRAKYQEAVNIIEKLKTELSARGTKMKSLWDFLPDEVKEEFQAKPTSQPEPARVMEAEPE